MPFKMTCEPDDYEGPWPDLSVSAPAAPQMTDAEMIRTEAWQSITDELAHAAYLRGIEEGKRQAAAPDAPQAEPVFYVHLDGIRAMPPDIFAAWSPTAKQTAHEYRPVFDHPPPDELARLRAEVEALKAENAALASWQCLFTDGTTGLYHDGCGNAQCARDHLVVHLTAEVEALRADAERWRYINTRNNVWRRHNTAGEEHSALCVILPYGADLSCRATREIAIDAARAPQQAEPVAWVKPTRDSCYLRSAETMLAIHEDCDGIVRTGWMPLYLHPPAAPQQAEPVAQIGWADEFGNLFPMGAWKPTQRTHHDSHKTAWRPVYLHPPAAEVQRLAVDLNRLRVAAQAVTAAVYDRERLFAVTELRATLAALGGGE